MGKMRLAVLDANGDVIHAWDDAVLAQKTIERVTARKVARFRPRLRKKIEKALAESVHEFLLEVARL